MFAKKNFTINLIHYIHIVCQILSTFTTVIVYSQSAPSLLHIHC